MPQTPRSSAASLEPDNQEYPTALGGEGGERERERERVFHKVFDRQRCLLKGLGEFEQSAASLSLLDGLHKHTNTNNIQHMCVNDPQKEWSYTNNSHENTHTPDRVFPGSQTVANPKSDTLTFRWSSSSMFSGCATDTQSNKKTLHIFDTYF